jgi:hypothetical protein
VIRKAIIAACVIYLAITALQVVQVGSVLWEGIVFGIVLLGGSALYLYRDEHRLERLEIGVLWLCVLLFALYMALRLAGVF